MIDRQKSENADRLDVLLAMSLALGERRVDAAETGENRFDSFLPDALERLSALPDADLRMLRERAEAYENLSAAGRQKWTTRVLQRVTAPAERLDKDVHYTQLARVLAAEPDYIRQFILRNLSPKTARDIAALLGFAVDDSPLKNMNPALGRLVRRRFLANFAAREDLAQNSPLAALSGDDVLRLLQRLGQNEIAVVCRGIKDVENLAPFLRQFEKPDAEAIVKRIAEQKNIKRPRIAEAEATVQAAWQSEPDATLVVQFIGLRKIAAAFKRANRADARFTMQKLPVNIADKLTALINAGGADAGDYAAEIERAATEILRDNLPETVEFVPKTAKLRLPEPPAQLSDAASDN